MNNTWFQFEGKIPIHSKVIAFKRNQQTDDEDNADDHNNDGTMTEPKQCVSLSRGGGT